MASFDPRSVIAITGTLSLLGALIILRSRRGLHVSIKGTDIWAAGVMVIFLAHVVMGQRDQLPDFLTAVIANAILWYGMASCVAGLNRFAEQTVPVMTLAIAGVIFLTASAVYVLLYPDYPMRLITNAFFIFLFAMLSLKAAACIIPRSLPVKAMIACYVALAGLAALRMVMVLSGVDETRSLLGGGVIQTGFLIGYGLLGLFANATFLLTVNERQYDVLRHAAAYDPLSGLLNRGAVIDLLEREIGRVNRRGGCFSVLMIDIDHFKRINDSHGHAVGDQTIVDFSHSAVLQLRRSDLLSRYGGEEFLAVLPETDLSVAVHVAERVRAGAANSSSAGPDYSVSIGVARYVKGMTQADLLRAADRALYSAKEKGRNRVEVAVVEARPVNPAEKHAATH